MNVAERLSKLPSPLAGEGLGEGGNGSGSALWRCPRREEGRFEVRPAGGQPFEQSLPAQHRIGGFGDEGTVAGAAPARPEERRQRGIGRLREGQQTRGGRHRGIQQVGAESIRGWRLGKRRVRLCAGSRAAPDAT